MLLELSIQNFAIIDQLDLSFEPGFNVLTGETGAGKSIMIDAMGLLLGERAQSEFIRTGTDKAVVEGVFHLDEELRAEIRPILEENGLIEEDESAESIILTREIRTQGANICRVNRSPVTLRLLQSIGDQLIDIHGQGEHLSLLRRDAQLRLLDRYAGTWPLRNEFAEQVHELQRVRTAMQKLRMSDREKVQRVDRLKYIVKEIEEANLRPDEEEELKQEQRRLSNAKDIARAARQVYVLLYEGVEEQPAVVDVLGQVQRALRDIIKHDESLKDDAKTVEEAQYLLDDVARRVGDYADQTQHDPARLTQVEDRLNTIFRLKRKYGDTIEEVLAAGREAQQELEDIANAEERLEKLRVVEAKLLRKIGDVGEKLSRLRRNAAEELSRALEDHLRDLRMEKARFSIDFVWNTSTDGAPVSVAFGNDADARYAFDTTGLDTVTFMISPNPGEPLKPMAKIASGGETARLMLALKTVLGEADETPILIFDEIDTGIGGGVGTIVGEKLSDLSRRHQVLCVTHLPQLAAFGDMHVHIYKMFDGERTVTRAEPLDEEARLAELAEMVGTGTSAREAALEMRDRARNNASI